MKLRKIAPALAGGASTVLSTLNAECIYFTPWSSSNSSNKSR